MRKNFAMIIVSTGATLKISPLKIRAKRLNFSILNFRFNDMIRVPTPPTVQFHPPEPLPSLARSMTTQTAEMESETENEPLTIAEAISSSRLIKFTFALSLLAALAAIFYYHVFGKPFGPHVTYVNGPPPV